MHLLSLDPGNTTGWAVFNAERHELLQAGADKLTLYQLYKMIASTIPDEIVYESFRLYASKSDTMINNDFYPSQLIGVIKLYAEQFQVPIITQSAAKGKAIWKDDKLIKFGYSHNIIHARDAIRHGLTYLETHRTLEGWLK